MRQYFAKESYNLIDPTDRSHPKFKEKGICTQHTFAKLPTWSNKKKGGKVKGGANDIYFPQ